MNETKSLPSRDAFYSTIQESSITEEEHKFAKLVWKKFEIKNLTEYCKLYCRIDTLLLAEIFEKFRHTMMNFSGLDPAHYVSLPGFGWDTMLKTTKCEIGLPTDIDQVHFIENSIRGGLSFINTRHAESEDPDKSLLRYIDANNLYGLAQSGKLPYDEYSWLDDDELLDFDVKNVNISGGYGYILEVDLLYPSCLHYHHNDYPLAPEQKKVSFEDLSPFSKMCYKKSTGSEKYVSTKLVSSLEDKKNYVVHIRNLQLYLSLGMICSKIHRILKFRQKAFIKPFIDKCTEERKNAKSEFEKGLFKKICNSCYGKTIENVRGYIKIKLHTSEKSLLKAVSQHTYKNYSIIDENVVTTTHSIEEIMHNKPYAAGFTILEYSKHFMYDFFYNKLLKTCGRDSINLCMTDTDSFIFHIKNNDVYENKLSSFMDYSNYSTDHKLYNNTKKAQLGYFKDEISSDKYIAEFVGLRSKCYALKLQDRINGDESFKKTCKGLGKCSIRNRLKFEEYKKSLFNRVDVRHYFTGIISKKHNISTVIRNKKALSCFDSKRYIYPCGIHSSPFGSKLIRKYKGSCFQCGV